MNCYTEKLIGTFWHSIPTLTVSWGPSAGLVVACVYTHHARTLSNKHRHTQPCWVICFVWWMIHVLRCSATINWCGWQRRQNWFLLEAIKHNATAHCQNLQGYYLERKLMPLLNRFMDNVMDIEKKSIQGCDCDYPSSYYPNMSDQCSCIHVYESNPGRNRWFQSNTQREILVHTVRNSCLLYLNVNMEIASNLCLDLSEWNWEEEMMIASCQSVNLIRFLSELPVSPYW